jgi:hypothetical protein
MANTFVDNSDNLTRVASLLATKDLKVASLINQAFSDDFSGYRGASVNVRIPAALTAQTRNLGVVTDYTTSDLTEGTQAVTLTARQVQPDRDLRIGPHSECRGLCPRRDPLAVRGSRDCA